MKLTDRELLEKIVKQDIGHMAGVLASDPDCPDWIRDYVVNNGTKDSKLSFIRSGHATPDELRVLSQVKSWRILGAVLLSPNCPAELLAKYADTGKKNVRMTVACNTSCPDEILMKLAQDLDPVVKINVVRNPSVRRRF